MQGCKGARVQGCKGARVHGVQGCTGCKRGKSAKAAIASDCVDAPMFRITLNPGDRTGLVTVSQAMIDKVVSVPREAIGPVIGRCSPDELHAVDDALRIWLSL